jgi:hypothetical protein
MSPEGHPRRPCPSNSGDKLKKRNRETKKGTGAAGRMKTCRHCGEQKATGEFPANRRCRDGLSSWCRACHDEASARSRIKKAEREAPIIEAQRKEAHAKWMAEWGRA